MAAQATESSPSAAADVLTNPALLSAVTQFQRGIPVCLHELTKRLDANDQSPQHVEHKHGFGRVWMSVIRFGDLAAVQLAYRTHRAIRRVEGKQTDVLVLPTYAAAFGRLDVIQWLHTVAVGSIDPAPSWYGAVLFEAVRGKHDDIARWLMTNRPEACQVELPGCMAHAAGKGNLRLLQELIAFRPDALTADVMDSALREPQWDVILYLHEHSPAGCSSHGMDEAASRGHLDVVQFLDENRGEGGTTRAMDRAAANGYLHVVQFLNVHRTEGCTTAAMDGAAANGHLAIVQYLDMKRLEGCTTEAMDRAATNGHVEVVRYLHEHRREGCSVKAMLGAARHNHLDVVQFLHENRPEGCANRAISDAAGNGHLDMVKFLHEKRGMKVEHWVIHRALMTGDVAMVRYLHESMNVPFPANAWATVNARGSGNEELVAYLESQQRDIDGVIPVK